LMMKKRKTKMSTDCPNCGTKILGDKKVGDKVWCFKCSTKFIIILYDGVKLGKILEGK
jgi:hypothetical protein